MKKLYLSLLLSIPLLSLTATAKEYEPTLKPIDQTFGKGEAFMVPLEELGMRFGFALQLFDGASACVKCDGEIVAAATSLEIINESDDSRKPGNLIIHFEKQNLPKGKSYTLHLSRGAVGWVECYCDIQIINPELNIPFSIPETLGTPRCSWDGSVIEDSGYMCEGITGVRWNYEIALAGEPKFLLYREDELIGEYPARVGYDWGLGVAYPQIPSLIYFDKGVIYHIVLPEGSVSAIERSDIVNERAEFTFIGCHEDLPDGYFTYKWCSLFDNRSDILGEVDFTYDRPVSLAEGAKLQLWEGDGEQLVKEADARIRTEVNCWIVTADFGGIPLDSPRGYTLVIPEGAVISDGEIGMTSQRVEVKVPDSSGIQQIGTGHAPGNQTIYSLDGRIVEEPAAGQIYIIGGKLTIFR